MVVMTETEEVRPQTSATLAFQKEIQPGNSHNKDNVAIETALTKLQEDVGDLEKLLAERKHQEKTRNPSPCNEGIQHLESIADRINALAAQLETEILKFQEKAIEVNQGYRLIQQSTNLKTLKSGLSRQGRSCPIDIWEMHHSAIPIVVKRGEQFVLTAKTMDLLDTREDEPTRRARAAQRRREALEQWLVERRKPIVDSFSGL